MITDTMRIDFLESLLLRKEIRNKNISDLSMDKHGALLKIHNGQGVALRSSGKTVRDTLDIIIASFQ